MDRPTVILLSGILAFTAAGLAGCGAPSRLETVQTLQLGARLAVSRDEIAEERRTIALGRRDTVTVTGEKGETLILMKAIKDDETGEMVANEVIDAAVGMAPDRIVYVSCDASTLARDLARFREYGWQIGDLQPVDLFPRTGHVETVVLLSRVK